MASSSDPLPGFYFSVEFAAFPTPDRDMCFQEVSGLEARVDYEEIKAGGQNTEALFVPKPVGFGTLSLKRSLTTSSAFVTWVEAALSMFRFVPVDLLVCLKNQKGNPAVAWYVAGCLPTSWNSTGIDATKSDLVIETLDMKYRYFRRLTPLLS
ncbi:phage tail protein [Pseudokordiimonas caeni]|uniref:phage tail protein n=1 Tax=Pseudokordiimonas caeni TaxID=2997908 RepID=UPI002812688F|nr:phage tail protein [Pseudokordiimonas caeni]